MIIISVIFILEQYFDRHKELCTEQELNSSGLRLQSEQVDIPEVFKEIPSLHQGERQYSEIVIETYLNVKGECKTCQTITTLNSKNLKDLVSLGFEKRYQIWVYLKNKSMINSNIFRESKVTRLIF